jgi:hypothetical protein
VIDDVERQATAPPAGHGFGPAGLVARGLIALAMALPWLTVLPVHGVLGVIAPALSLVAAGHGVGLIVARLADKPTANPLLVIQWGIATLIGLSGIAIAVRIGTLASHAVLVFAGAAVHTAVLGVRFSDYEHRARQALDGPRSWLIPALVLAGFGALIVLGAGGDTLVRPFDDEGHVLAQLVRVLDTGTLADPVGYPRSAQLGGQIALAAIAFGAGNDLPAVIEPLALMLALALAMSQIGARDPSSALWALILLIAAFALAFAPVDPLPCWIAVGLIVALYTMLGDAEPPPALPIAITAGALIALRYELAPIAAVALVIAWLRRRHDHHRTAILIGGVFAVGFPFLVTRMVAWRSVPMIAHASLTAPAQTAFVLRLVLTAAIAAPAALVLRLALPDSRALRSAATATAVALGAVAAHLTSAGPYSLRLAWPIAIAFAITLAIELARTRTSGVAALISSLVLCVLIYEGREAPGRLRWSRRLAQAATGVEYLQRPPGGAAAPYARLLADVPPGATVAVWVTAPEQLDYARHRIVDLRTPIGTRLRQLRRDPRGSRLEALLTALSASFLLVETDDARAERAQRRWLYGLLCRDAPTDRPWCADNLEVIALRHPVVARRDHLQLVDLRH